LPTHPPSLPIALEKSSGEGFGKTPMRDIKKKKKTTTQDVAVLSLRLLSEIVSMFFREEDLSSRKRCFKSTRTLSSLPSLSSFFFFLAVTRMMQSD
jgi:hypothetical protein